MFMEKTSLWVLGQNRKNKIVWKKWYTDKMVLDISFCLYTILSVYQFVRVPFCPYHFVQSPSLCSSCQHIRNKNNVLGRQTFSFLKRCKLRRCKMLEVTAGHREGTSSSSLT